MADTRYHQIRTLIEAEIGEIMADIKENDYSDESTRDELIVNYLDFIKKDLVSDNY
jgi:hypothetical protein